MNTPSQTDADEPAKPRFVRALGLRSAVAVNMTAMCGIGPFVTMPLMVAAMGGPQVILAWLLGALLAMADGLVWAELGAAMPGAGGTYLYLREAFQYRTGRLMPFLFIWVTMLVIPLTMSTGVIGVVQYLGVYFPSLADDGGPGPASPVARLTSPAHLKAAAVSFGMVALVMVLLYRRIGAVGKVAGALFAVMLLTVAAVIAACAPRVDPRMAFGFTPGAFARGGAFWLGLGQGLIFSIYDYAGYNNSACIGEELREPGRTIPRSVIYSILGMMAIYLTMNVGVMGVVPWKDVAESKSIATLVMERTWGHGAAMAVTGLVIVTGFASVMMGLLGASRVPYNAARDKLFFAPFGRLHPRLNFPHVALLAMGAITAVASFFPLDALINMLTAAMVLVQCIAQVVALTVLRKRQPGLRRPFRVPWYPIPNLAALAGWTFVYLWSGWPMILLSLAWLALGAAAFLVWARVERTWPFGEIEVEEAFLDSQRAASETQGA